MKTKDTVREPVTPREAAESALEAAADAARAAATAAKRHKLEFARAALMAALEALDAAEAAVDCDLDAYEAATLRHDVLFGVALAEDELDREAEAALARRTANPN